MKLEPRICRVCGCEYTPARVNQYLCGKVCKAEYHRSYMIRYNDLIKSVVRVRQESTARKRKNAKPIEAPKPKESIQDIVKMSIDPNSPYHNLSFGQIQNLRRLQSTQTNETAE